MQRSKLHRFLLAQKWAVAGFILSVIVTVVLVFTHLAEAIYFDDPRHKNEDLQPWMTPRYIALSYDLPRPVVLDLLNIEEGSDFPKRIDVLAERLGLSLSELTAKVRDTAASYKELNND